MSIIPTLITIFNEKFRQIRAYVSRILADGGTLKNRNVTQGYIEMAKANGIWNSIRFAWMGEAGGKFRTSTIYTYWTKIYSLFYPSARYGANVVPEAISNGDTAVGVSVAKGLIVSSVNGELKLDVIQNDGWCYLFNIPCTPNTQYNMKWTCRSDQSEMYYFINDQTNNNPIIYSTRYYQGTNSIIFTTPSTCVNVSCWVMCDGSKVGTAYVDNWTIVPILLDGIPTDATQTTAGNQPFVSGNIAPNEKLALKNPNGGANYMTHPTISFAANEAWSVTTVLNWNGQSGNVYLTHTTSTGIGIILKVGTTFNFFINEKSKGGYYVQWANLNTALFLGKNYIITIVKSGTNIELFVNGLSYGSKTWNVAVDFIGINNPTEGICGNISSFYIRSKALTASQVAAEASYLRSIYPEIPSVTIGSQVWATSNCEMVCTPQGNLISNITENTFIEKIINAANREFSSDTGFWNKSANWSISGGVASSSSASGVMYGLLDGTAANVVGRFAKIVVSISNYSSGTLKIALGDGGTFVNIGSSDGTFTIYSKWSGSNGWTYLEGLVGSIDNISVQIIGWANSTELYDAVYDATAGTVEQKTYAGVKAAAMWCYYNNDATIGAVYGKLYNWYAVKLLQMDIDYYNAANPSTPWGWRVPTATDFNTLATTLGGASVAGGKMKKEGFSYWNSPNIGAANSSGFSGLPTGQRRDSGLFIQLNESCVLFDISSVSQHSYLRYDEVPIGNYGGYSDIWGFGLRLIKS